MRRTLFTAAVCTAIVGVIAPPAAYAGTTAYVTPGGYSTPPQGAAQEFRDLGAHVTLTLLAGETHYLNSVLYVGSAAQKTEVTQVAGCWPTGVTETLTNALALSEAGTNVDGGVPSVAQTSRFEFTPSLPGIYDCSLHAIFYNHTSKTDYGHIYVLTGSMIQDVAGPLAAHAQAYLPSRVLLTNNPTLGTPSADINLIASYSVPQDVTAIDVISDFGSTNCYVAELQHLCPDGSDTTNSTFTSQLIVQQLNTEGNVCHTVSDSVLTSTVSPDTHHQKIYHRLNNFGIFNDCGSFNVMVHLHVAKVSGNDIQIETANQSYSLLFEA